MKTKFIKLILVLFVFIITMFFISSNSIYCANLINESILVSASSVEVITSEDSGRGGGTLDDVEESLDDYKSSGVEGTDKLAEKSNLLIGAIQAVGTVVAVITLSIIAIKYMVASVEEKADYKKTMVPYVIGAGSILIMSNLVGIIYSVIQNINV